MEEERENMKRIAIVTGASSGMGRAFAKRICEIEPPKEIWLIARREERMKALASELPVPARIFALDLTDPGSIEVLKAALEEEQPDVRALINAAGFGKFGTWKDMTRQETDDMIALNCRAAVDLTVTALPHMGKGARLLEICSCAGFQPLQGLNVYAATKAFLLSFTRALRWETAGKGVKITAVCPGWVKTEFMKVARNTKNGGTVRHFPLALRPETVAKWALRENGWNFAVATCAAHTFVQRIAAKILPNCALMACWEGIRRI